MSTMFQVGDLVRPIVEMLDKELTAGSYIDCSTQAVRLIKGQALHLYLLSGDSHWPGGKGAFWFYDDELELAEESIP